MSGELQTIPARHGVATFVPRGRTIKVINTYGKQVVSMWAFSLGPPPENNEEDGELEELDEEQVKQEAEGLKKAVEEGGGKEKTESEPADKEETEASSSKGKEAAKEKESPSGESHGGKETQTTSEEDDDTKEDAEDPPEQAPDAPDSEKTTENTEDTQATEGSSKQASKRTWASYLPSIPYRNKGAASKPDAAQKPNAEEEKAQNEANTKKWSSYIPTGKSFSSYVPNVQLPDSKEAVSSFKASHYRDPNKSYAEQLYDFSKTPVGAGTIAAATGSGYASSVYAVYSAYAVANSSNSSQPPMEYLSLPHSRAASHKLVPEVDDELLTNLRNPIITLVEDTTPGAHDTLTAACDANQYSALGVDKPEEHGSCAENLVLALKELNETAGLKGAKAIGADISVNIAPTPLHLFMNAPLLFEKADADGAGAKGITLKVDEPKGKKRSFVRFRAERDVVVVLSACPMDVGKQNGGRCMAANFMVENVQEGEDLAASVASSKSKKTPKKLGQKGKSESEAEKKAPEPKKEEKQTEAEEQKQPEAEQASPPEEKAPEPEKKKAPKKLAPKKDDAKSAPSAAKPAAPKEPEKEEKTEESAPAKKKPRKLQPRSGSSATPTKSS